METAKCQPKWQNKAYVELVGSKAEEVWPFLADFCSLNKWFPSLQTCTMVEGVEGQPGCVRYCAGFKTHIAYADKSHVNWTKQKLLSIDPDNMTFSYSIIDGNVGFNSYVSKVRVLPGVNQCGIEWEYEVEPVKGWKPEDLDSFIGNGLQVMAERMQEALNIGAQKSELASEPLNVGAQKSELASEALNVGAQKSELASEALNVGAQKSELASEALNVGA